MQSSGRGLTWGNIPGICLKSLCPVFDHSHTITSEISLQNALGLLQQTPILTVAPRMCHAEQAWLQPTKIKKYVHSMRNTGRFLLLLPCPGNHKSYRGGGICGTLKFCFIFPYSFFRNIFHSDDYLTGNDRDTCTTIPRHSIDQTELSRPILTKSGIFPCPRGRGGASMEERRGALSV